MVTGQELPGSGDVKNIDLYFGCYGMASKGPAGKLHQMLKASSIALKPEDNDFDFLIVPSELIPTDMIKIYPVSLIGSSG